MVDVRFDEALEAVERRIARPQAVVEQQPGDVAHQVRRVALPERREPRGVSLAKRIDAGSVRSRQRRRASRFQIRQRPDDTARAVVERISGGRSAVVGVTRMQRPQRLR